MLYRNKKTGDTYRHLAHAIDATNQRHGAPLVVYCPDDNEHSIFVRDAAEFERKFKPIDAAPAFTDNAELA